MPESRKQSKQERKILWEPQPKQAIALEYDDIYELFYGGAKGGGKSDYLVVDYSTGINRYGSDYNGILFRKTFPELEELISRTQQLYLGAFPGCKYLEGKKTWNFPSGATLKLRFLETDQDVYHYTGHQYQWIGFDELTNWVNPFPYIFMHSCARSAKGVPIRIRASGNPGNPGHLWVKQRFIDPAPQGMVPVIDEKTGLLRIFIPARLDDNIRLMEQDPQYENRLKNLPEALYKAYRWGDWDVFVGQAIGEWDPRRHIIEPFDIPGNSRWYMTFDWGYGRPFSTGWWTQQENKVVRAYEWYGWTGTPNEGLRLTDSEVAEGILTREARWGINSSSVTRWGGRDCFNKKPNYLGGGQGPSTADVFRSHGINIRPGDDDRHKKLAAFHNRLRITDDGPGMVVFKTCEQFIRTIPALVVDRNDPEDIDTDCEDHVYDEACHIVMAKAGDVSMVPTGLDPESMCD